MIIRATYKDNDYTNLIEEFFKEFKFSNYYLYSSRIEDPLRYRDVRIDCDELFEMICMRPKQVCDNKEVLHQFCKYVRKSLAIFMRKNGIIEPEDEIYDQLEVTCIKSLEHIDGWENGEVVYYFIQQDKYITM